MNKKQALSHALKSNLYSEIQHHGILGMRWGFRKDGYTHGYKPKEEGRLKQWIREHKENRAKKKHEETVAMTKKVLEKSKAKSDSIYNKYKSTEDERNQSQRKIEEYNRIIREQEEKERKRQEMLNGKDMVKAKSITWESVENEMVNTMIYDSCKNNTEVYAKSCVDMDNSIKQLSKGNADIDQVKLKVAINQAIGTMTNPGFDNEVKEQLTSSLARSGLQNSDGSYKEMGKQLLLASEIGKDYGEQAIEGYRDDHHNFDPKTGEFIPPKNGDYMRSETPFDILMDITDNVLYDYFKYPSD